MRLTTPSAYKIVFNSAHVVNSAPLLLQDAVSGAYWGTGDRLASAGDGGEVMVWAPPPDAEDASLVHTWKVCQLLRYGSMAQLLVFIDYSRA